MKYWPTYDYPGGNPMFYANSDEADKAAFAPRFWRLRWWFARTFKTRDYRYVVNSEAMGDDFSPTDVEAWGEVDH